MPRKKRPAQAEVENQKDETPSQTPSLSDSGQGTASEQPDAQAPAQADGGSTQPEPQEATPEQPDAQAAPAETDIGPTQPEAEMLQDATFQRLDCEARELAKQIDDSERFVTEQYFRLHEVLTEIRPRYRHGDWGNYLSEIGVTGTKASNAKTLHDWISAEEAQATPIFAALKLARARKHASEAHGDLTNEQIMTLSHADALKLLEPSDQQDDEIEEPEDAGEADDQGVAEDQGEGEEMGEEDRKGENAAIPQIHKDPKPATSTRAGKPNGGCKAQNNEAEEPTPAMLPPLNQDFVMSEADEDALTLFVQAVGGFTKAAQVFQAGWAKRSQQS